MRQLRETRKWSQAHLAELLELAPNYVGYIERGERIPSVPMLVRLAKTLETTSSELLGEYVPEGRKGEIVEDHWVRRSYAVLRDIPRELRPLATGVLKGFAEAAREWRRS